MRLTLAVLFLLGGFAFGQQDTVDPRLVGTWSASVVNAQGTWTFTWHQNADGTYQTDIAGPASLPPDHGTFGAANGTWIGVNALGVKNGGTYVLTDDGTLTLTGGDGGSLAWKRVEQDAPAGEPPSGPASGDGRAPDPAIVGTWTQEFTYQGVAYKAFMRLAADGYRGWAIGPHGEDGGGDSGSIVTEGGVLEITKVDGTQISARYALEGADSLVLTKENGLRQAWHRAPADTRSPGEASAGAGLSEADKNDPEKCFQEGSRLYEAKEMRAAVTWFLRAAERGHAGAELQVGWHYEKGIGVAQSWTKAAAWYRKSAEHGNATAMKNLGQLCEDGMGVPEDWVQAAAWYRKGADLGYGAAEAALGRAYQFGVGVAQDRGACIEWDKRALEHGEKDCEHWVHWLPDPTNNIGFRNQAEHDLVIDGKLRTSSVLWGADPAGLLFHGTAERMAWLLKLRREVDQDEAEAARRMAEWGKQYHAQKVRELESQGYSHDEAERKAN